MSVAVAEAAESQRSHSQGHRTARHVRGIAQNPLAGQNVSRRRRFPPSPNTRATAPSVTREELVLEPSSIFALDTPPA